MTVSDLDEYEASSPKQKVIEFSLIFSPPRKKTQKKTKESANSEEAPLSSPKIGKK